MNGESKYFVFNVLPFGISSASFIFTKLMKSVVRYWRSLGFNIVMYLDDGLGGASELERSISFSHLVKKDLLELGFIIAESKCCLVTSE
jgi:hypothetical protein